MTAEPPFDTSRPFTRAEALKAGLDPARGRVGKFRRLFQGVYVDATVPVTPVLRVEAALKLFVDLCWPSVRLIVEYDGRHHVERIESWESDLERREAIDDDDWRILVVISNGIYREPEQTLHRIWRLLRARRLVGVPTVLSDDWRPHFPGR